MADRLQLDRRPKSPEDPLRGADAGLTTIDEPTARAHTVRRTVSSPPEERLPVVLSLVSLYGDKRQHALPGRGMSPTEAYVLVTFPASRCRLSPERDGPVTSPRRQCRSLRSSSRNVTALRKLPHETQPSRASRGGHSLPGPPRDARDAGRQLRRPEAHRAPASHGPEPQWRAPAPRPPNPQPPSASLASASFSARSSSVSSLTKSSGLRVGTSSPAA